MRDAHASLKARSTLSTACTGMSGYSRRGREASGPPLVISKYSPARARTSSSAPLCPPAPPALGREFRFQKAMMALAPAEIPPISDSMKLNWHSHDYASVSQSVFPGPNPLVPQKPKKYPVFPEGHRQGRWPAAGPGFPADSACMRMLNRIDRLILLLILGTKRVWPPRAAILCHAHRRSHPPRSCSMQKSARRTTCRRQKKSGSPVIRRRHAGKHDLIARYQPHLYTCVTCAVTLCFVIGACE